MTSTLWPVRVAEAQWCLQTACGQLFKAPDAFAALRIQLDCLPDASFENLGMNCCVSLSMARGILLFVDELCLTTVRRLAIRDLAPKFQEIPIFLSADRLRAVGFSEEKRSCRIRALIFAYACLQEVLFAFRRNFSSLIWRGSDRLAALRFKDKFR